MSDTPTHDVLVRFWEHHHVLIEFMTECGDIWYCGECGCAYEDAYKYDARYDDNTNTLYCYDCWMQWRFECPNCGWWAKGETMPDEQTNECPNCDTPLVERRKEGEG